MPSGVLQRGQQLVGGLPTAAAIIIERRECSRPMTHLGQHASCAGAMSVPLCTSRAPATYGRAAIRAHIRGNQNVIGRVKRAFRTDLTRGVR